MHWSIVLFHGWRQMMTILLYVCVQQFQTAANFFNCTYFSPVHWVISSIVGRLGSVSRRTTVPHPSGFLSYRLRFNVSYDTVSAVVLP